MKLLITGANGFMGRNLRATLAERSDELLLIEADTPAETLRESARQADFVFHLAGVNRPKDTSEFQKGNADFTETLLDLLKEGKRPPVLLCSSTQAALDNPYGQSKLAAENVVRAYGEQTGAETYVYRLTNAFGKWSRPNYNTVVATFCHNVARGLPISVNDPSHAVKLVYIDDIVAEFLRALDGKPTRIDGGFCLASPEYEITLGRLASLVESFRDGRESLDLPDQSDPFVRKLFATYQSFLPPDELAVRATVHADARGSFTELMHMGGYGQVSVNVSKPHILKGEHWHHTKHEKFMVVSGQGVIRFRSPFEERVYAYAVDGATPTIVDIPPGYTHNIENVGESDLVTIMWASEAFDPTHPDTYRLPVEMQRSDKA